MGTTVITGASSGLGRSLAKLVAADGTAVAVLARRKDLLDSLVNEIQEAGGEALSVTCDVTDRRNVRQAFREVETRFGPIDCLVANAGGGSRTTVDSFSAESIEAMLQLNVLGTANCLELVLPSMLERRRGHIVVTSSLASYRGLPGAAGYCGAKSALTTMMESLRIDLKPLGIDVTIITPGFIHKKPHKKPKPLRVELAKAARITHRAILRRKRTCVFPWSLRLAMVVARCLPAGLYDRLFFARRG